ncbi:hypothetical protein BGX38DRAFT_1138905 [Terfezia claveryi]|nr:hypothetical protein BGX38DRAFT_1138905 [Terfezia claveryi]
MSSTLDSGPISQEVGVTDEAEHHALVEEVEKAIEGAEEALPHFILGIDKERSKIENVNCSIENQTDGESKDESTDGAIGVTVETTDSEIPVTSAPIIDLKDDVSSGITYDEHTSTSISNTESQKSEGDDIIHHNEESGEKPEEKAETAEEEKLISSSYEAETEGHLVTDDTKESQATQVESVQESAKEEPSLPTHHGTEPNAVHTPEKIPPTPKHEAEGEAASSEAPIEVSPEQFEHSPPATDIEDTESGANASTDKPTRAEPESQGTVEEVQPEMGHTASSDSALDFTPAIVSEAEPETPVGNINEELGAPYIEEARFEPPVTEEGRPIEVAQETPLETKYADESELSQHEDVSIAENPADLERSEAVEPPAVQDKALEAEGKTEEPTVPAPTVDNYDTSVDSVSSKPSHDQMDAPVVDDHDVLALDSVKEQSRTTYNEEGPKEEALAEESKPETESSLVEESQSDILKTDEEAQPVAEITAETTLVSEELQDLPVATEQKTEDRVLESPKEEAVPQETDSTPHVEASVEESSSEEAAIEDPISAEADVTPEKNETEEIHEEGAEVTAPAEATKVDAKEEEEAPVQRDESSSEPPMVEERKPEEQVVLMVESSEHVEEPAALAVAEETEHETEANGKEEVHSGEVKEEEDKGYDGIVQGSAPEAKAEETKPEPEASVQEILALVDREMKPEPEVIPDETAHIEDAPVTSETIDETPVPAATGQNDSTEQTAPAEVSALVPATADEHSESVPVEGKSEEFLIEENSEFSFSVAVESEEVKEEVPVVEEEPKAEDKTFLDEAKPEAEEIKVEGNTVAESAVETKETVLEHTNGLAGEAVEQVPHKTNAEVASEEPLVGVNEIENVPATETPLEEGVTPVAEEPVPEVAQISGPAAEEILAEEAPVVVEEISIVEEKVSEESPALVTGESKVEGVEAAPEVLADNGTTAEEAPDADNQQTEATSVEELAPEGSSATKETPALETPVTEQTASSEVSTPMNHESAEQQAATEELVIEEVPTKVEEPLAVEEPEMGVVTPATEDLQIPSVEKVPATEQEPVAVEEESTPENSAAVDEPVTELEAPAVEEPHTEEFPVEEPTVEFSTVVEEPVTEAPIPVEEEQVIMSVIEEVLVDQPCVELATVEEPVTEAAVSVIQAEESAAPQDEEVPTAEEVPAIKEELPEADEVPAVDEVPVIEEVSATATEEPETTEDPVAEAVTPAVEEQVVSTPAIEEVPAEEPLVEHPAVVESVTGVATHAVEELDAPTPEVELVAGTDYSLAEEPTSIEERTTEAITPTVQGEEARAPAIEDTPVEQPLVQHVIVEEEVTEILTTPVPVQEEVPVEQPPVEYALVEETDTEAPPTPAPEQEEISIPAIEEIPVEKQAEQVPVEEPVTEVLPTLAPEQEEISTPAIEEAVVEHASDEELVTKSPTPTPEQEEISTPEIEEVSVENAPVESALVDEPVTEAQTPVAEQEEVSTPEIEEVSVENSPVEIALVDEPVTEAQTPVAEKEEVSTPEIEEVSVETAPVQQTLVDEPVTETVASAIQEEEVIALPIEDEVEQPTVEQAFVEEPVTEAPAPVIEQEQVSTPTIEEDPAEELATEAPTFIDEQEQVSTPAIEGSSVETPLGEVTLVEEPVIVAATPAVEEEQTQAPILDSPVQDSAVELAIPVEAGQESPAGGAAAEGSAPETSELTLATKVQSVEGDKVTPTADGKESPTFAEGVAKTAAVPEALVPQEEPVENADHARTEQEALKIEVIDEPQEIIPTEDVKQEPVSAAMEVPQEQKRAEPATESHEATTAAPEDHKTYAEVAPTDTEKQASSDDVEPEAVTTDQLVSVHEPKPEEDAPESVNVVDESAPEASAEAAAVEHISESPVDVSAPVEVPSIFGGDIPSTKEEETELPLTQEAESMDKEGVAEETVTANVPAKETAQEQRDFDAELTVPLAFLSHPVLDVPSDEEIPQNPLEDQKPVEVLKETSTEIPEIPALVVSKPEENQPSHEDFGVDTTTCQKDASELSKADAEPDEVITAQEPETPSVATGGIVVGVDEDTGEGASTDEFEHMSHADAVPDEQELAHEERATVQELQVELPENTALILVACETAAAVADSAATVDSMDRSIVATPIQVAAEIAAAVEDTAAELDPTDRSVVPTPVPVASEIAAEVEDIAATLDIDETLSKDPTPIAEAAETAAAVQDIAAILDPTDRSTVSTPIPIAAETAAAVEDTAAILDVDESGLEVSPISEAAEMAAAVVVTAVTFDATEISTVSTPIFEAAETTAAVEDTAASLDIDEDHSTVITPIPQHSDVAAEVAEVAKELDLVSEPEVASELFREEAQYSFRETPQPTSPLPETGTAVADSTPPVDIKGAPSEAAAPAPSPMVETPVTLEVEAAETTNAAEELDIASALPVSATPGEPVVDSPNNVAATTPIVDAPKGEVVEPTVEAAPVPQVIVEEDSKSKDGLSDNSLIASAGLAGATLIGGGIYAVTKNDKTEGVPMARTVTSESSKSVHDKPLSFNGDHILPHMKEVGPQVAEMEIHRAEIVCPTSNMLSKSVDAIAHDSELVDHEPPKDVVSAPEEQLTEGQWLGQSHKPESIPKPEPADTSKGKGPETQTPGSSPESIEEDDFVELLESSGHLQAPRMQRDLSGSSEFAESLISVDLISEALRYMRENNSEAAFRPPDIVVSEETTDGEHRTRNIVEVITPDTELITEPEPRRRDPSTRREQSRPSTRGSDMVSATHHKNLMENFWKLVFVGWLGGMGKFFVGLFGRKNMRESQLMSQQNLNFEQHMGGSAKGKEKEKEEEKVRGGPREEENKKKNGVTGNGVSASNGAGWVKVKESRRGSIKKKWNAYRKKGD